MKKRAAPLKITDTSVPVRIFLPTKRYGIRGMKDPNTVEDPTIKARARDNARYRIPLCISSKSKARAISVIRVAERRNSGVRIS
jgi:hypothetical protein